MSVKAYSIHYGLAHVDNRAYKREINPVPLADKDAHTMAYIARKEGFDVRHVRINEDATCRQFKDDFETIVKKMKEGDILKFSFAGHGTQVPDISGDEDDEPNDRGQKFDEGFCFYDGIIIDDTVAEMLATIPKGCYFIGMIDCCYSGEAFRYKIDGLQPSKNRIQELVDSFAFTGLWLSAARENQLAVGSSDKGGLFTQNALRLWDVGNFTGSYEEFHDKLRRISPAKHIPVCKELGINGYHFMRKCSPYKIDLSCMD